MSIELGVPILATRTATFKVKEGLDRAPGGAETTVLWGGGVGGGLT